jgi:phosphate transport system protein
MRSRFDEQLALLNQELTTMGALCEEAIALVAKALSSGDKEMLQKVVTLDGEIDQMEREIESLCLKLLLQQQPVARDLRQISAALKMVTDMERIGDQAEDIAEIIPFLEGHDIPAHGQIHEMAEATSKMVTDSIDAYVKKDLALAGTVVAYDDVVDDCFDKVKNDLIEIVVQNPADGGRAFDLLMIAKYFERIGDHAVNIAQWVRFSMTGNKES